MSIKVEKRPVAVRISQSGQRPLDGDLMLDPRARNGSRPETLMELLNGARQVIPFIESSHRQVVLVVRDNIGWVAVNRGADPKLLFPPDYRVTHGQYVQLFFTDENRIEAFLQWDRQDPYRRLSDYLNQCPAFFPATAGFGLVFINRSRLRQLKIVTKATVAEEFGERFPSASSLDESCTA